jgi:hypothetical protein
MSTTSNVASTHWIPTRGLAPVQWAGLGATALLITLAGLSSYWFQTNGRPPLTSPELVPLVILLILGATVLSLLPWLQTPRTVGLSPGGVRLVYPLRKVSVPWTDLMNVLNVSPRTVTFRPLSFNPKNLGGWHSISAEQARAILSDPRCPEVILHAEQRRIIFGS